jgi:TPR repeat protein
VYLGDIYASGDGVPVDLTEADHWYKEALVEYENLAEQGWAPAQKCLGRMYECGKGVDRDPSKAAYWYRKAAEQERINADSSRA